MRLRTRKAFVFVLLNLNLNLLHLLPAPQGLIEIGSVARARVPSRSKSRYPVFVPEGIVTRIVLPPLPNLFGSGIPFKYTVIDSAEKGT